MVCGRPKPMRNSLNGEMLTDAPAFFIALISSGVATMAWTICISLSSRPAFAMVAICPAAAREPLACTDTGRPSLRAAPISAL